MNVEYQIGCSLSDAQQKTTQLHTNERIQFNTAISEFGAFF
jgi:hypothetical protein